MESKSHGVRTVKKESSPWLYSCTMVALPYDSDGITDMQFTSLLGSQTFLESSRTYLKSYIKKLYWIL
jgi:hypothetical protein